MRDRASNVRLLRQTGWLSLIAVALLTFGPMVGIASAQDVDSRYRFQTIQTDHFRIHFHEEARDLVTALVPLTERTWNRFAARGLAPPALTHVVVSDQAESPNGFATPVPRNRILLYTVAPHPAGLLNPVAWLEALFVHEFTHIVHLDQARGWAAAGRRVFGRAPWLFPNLLLPTWQIEGLATLEESRLPGQPRAGRLHDPAFRNLLLDAARHDRVPPIDRINGGLSDWPSGLAPYVWGAGFHAFLEARYGRETLERLAHQTAGSLPWLGPLAFEDVFGASAGELWRAYAASLRAAAGEVVAAQQPSPDRLTFHGHVVEAGRFARAACATCPDGVVYSARTPHERPGIYGLAAGAPLPVRVATRYGGSTLSIAVDGRIYFDQQRVRRNVGSYSDLYVHDPRTGQVQRLDSSERLLDPDVSPDGTRVAAVRQLRPGRRDLVIARLTTSGLEGVTALAVGDDVNFSTPRWSPDGTRIVAIRQAASGPPRLVLIEPSSGTIHELASDTPLLWATPAWHPDGRAIVAAAAAGNGDAFNLFDVRTDTQVVRQLTALPSGATWPDVSADGELLLFTGYTPDGYDLFTLPYPGGAAIAVPESTTPPALRRTTSSVLDAGAVRAYRPWRTLLPTAWSPLVVADDWQVRAGASTAGRDVLGYHAWAASASWQVASERARPHVPGAPDWRVQYLYGRWPIQPFAIASRRTDDLLVRATPEHTAHRLPSIERDWEAGFVWPFVDYRRTHQLQLSVARTRERWTGGAMAGERDRSALRAGWRYSSAARPAYAISPERGLTAGTAIEVVVPSLGASAAGGAAAFDVRAYLPGVRRHDVVAIRAGVGSTWGEDSVRRVFSLGGGSAAPPPGTIDSRTAALLRGFPPVSFTGRHAVTLNVDYRLPLARPQRGVGLLPAFLHSLHAAVVADVAHAWSAAVQLDDAKTAAGGELAADLVLGYALRVTVAGGVAWGRDGAARSGWSPRPYLRLGYAF